MKPISSIDAPVTGSPGATADRVTRRPPAPWLQLIREAVEAVDYGTIQIKVHAGEVVQIETTRKIRVPSSHTAPSSDDPSVR